MKKGILHIIALLCIPLLFFGCTEESSPTGNSGDEQPLSITIPFDSDGMIWNGTQTFYVDGAPVASADFNFYYWAMDSTGYGKFNFSPQGDWYMEIKQVGDYLMVKDDQPWIDGTQWMYLKETTTSPCSIWFNGSDYTVDSVVQVSGFTCFDGVKRDVLSLYFRVVDGSGSTVGPLEDNSYNVFYFSENGFEMVDHFTAAGVLNSRTTINECTDTCDGP